MENLALPLVRNVQSPVTALFAPQSGKGPRAKSGQVRAQTREPVGCRFLILSPLPFHRKAGSEHWCQNRLSVCAARGEAVSATSDVQVPELELAEQRQKLTSLGGIVTDETVPEGHKGLHGFLYGDAGADVHDAGEAEFTVRAGEDDGTAVLSLDLYVAARETKKFAGVYALYAADSVVQYVGYSRNVILSLKAHRTNLGSETCASVKVKAYTDPALISRQRLEEQRQLWIQECGSVPPVGNGPQLHLWEGPNGPGTAAMSEEERSAYEEKKLKLRKAMGENLYDEVEGESEDSRLRRLRLLQATEGDDWSAVIDGQTSETVLRAQRGEQGGAAAHEVQEAAAEAGSPIVSPFARMGNLNLKLGEGPEGSQESPELTVASVDTALEEVRPYLIADGGNVEVVGVENGVVLLRLQGACGTCPSSTATMKMGIERSLRMKFGDALKEVAQVDRLETGASIQGVESLLDTLRPAINNFKGKVEVVSVDPMRGLCEVRYQGPPPVGMGIQAAIRDKFPDLRSVKLLDF